MEQGLFVQVVIIGQKYFDNKEEKEKTKNITSEGNPQDQCAGLIFIMSG